MNETRTASILQRVPVILAVTAASYGLALPAGARTVSTSGTPAASHQVQPATRH
jgi:hypothetical protein